MRTTKVVEAYSFLCHVSSITGQVIPMPSNANTAVPMKETQVVMLIKGFPSPVVSTNPIPFLTFLAPYINANTKIATSPTKMHPSAAM